MAKRKRLIAAATDSTSTLAGGTASPAKIHPPIAHIAGDASGLAAAEALSQEIIEARANGRLITSVAIDKISTSHIKRDRVQLDAAELEALKSSIRARGQQVPLDVIELEEGRYGLVSGLRRLTAVKELHAEYPAEGFNEVKVLIRPIASSASAYVAMVEENEIRADLSFYERARVAVEAAKAGVFETEQAAVKTLFSNTTPARRSKIQAFVALHKELGDAFFYPEAIPEKVGLALVKAVKNNPKFGSKLRVSIEQAQPKTIEEERRLIDAALKKKTPSASEKPAREVLRKDLYLEHQSGKLVLSGKGLTADFVDSLREFLKQG